MPLTQPITESSLNNTAESSSEIEISQSVSSTSIPQASTPSKPNSWAIFTSTFVTIFLAEIGDKTQITTLLMTAESHAPWIVFAGAGSALVMTSLLGVLVGRFLANRISPKLLERSAGITLVLIAFLLFLEVLNN